MVTVLVHHAVKDFATWKMVFDSNLDIRRAAGEVSAQIFHGEHDTHNVFMLFKWDSLENAEKYFDSEELKEVMANAGVLTKPKIHYLHEI